MADQSSAPQVVYQKINGKHYASWAFAMQIDIGGREQLGYIDGRLLSQAKVIPNIIGYLEKKHYLVLWVPLNQTKKLLGIVFFYYNRDHFQLIARLQI